MYFPRDISEIGDFLRSLKYNSNEENIRILDDILDRMRHMHGYTNKEVENLLFQYIMSLIRQDDNIDGERLYRLKEKNQYLESKLQQTLKELKEKNELISQIIPDVRSYKNLYIFILCHPKNNAIVGAEILSRINYLDKMTSGVTFIMPGYKRALSDDEVVNESDNNLQLTFDENLFIEMIQDLENESDGKFLYKDACELVFIGVESDGGYDFNNFQRLDLNLLSQKRGIDPVKLILSISQQFRTDKNDTIEIKKYVNQILGELTIQDDNPTIKIFIAGAKKLKEERSLLREELSKVENTHNLDIRSLTFEDFATSLTGEDRGRQADYNKFIEKEANVVIFIFDSTAGEITEEEFDIAYNSLKENKHPDIFVYVRKRSPFSLRNIFGDRRLQNIKNKIFAYQKEYYIEYENLENLRYLFYSDMVSYFIKEENK